MKIFAAQLNVEGDGCVNWKLERAASWKVTDERIQTCSIDCQWERNHHSAMHSTTDALQPLALQRLNISATPPVAWSFSLVQAPVSNIKSKFYRRWRWASMWMVNHRHCSAERKTRQNLNQHFDRLALENLSTESYLPECIQFDYNFLL